MDLEVFFEGHPSAGAVHDRVAALVASCGPAETRITKSQVVFRRRRGCAYLWIPGRYLAGAPGAVMA